MMSSFAQGPLRISQIDVTPAACVGGGNPAVPNTFVTVVPEGGVPPYKFFLGSVPLSPSGSFSFPLNTPPSLVINVQDSSANPVGTQQTITLNNVGSDFTFYSVSIDPVTNCQVTPNGAITIVTEGKQNSTIQRPLFSLNEPGGATDSSVGVFTGLEGQIAISFRDELATCAPVSISVPVGTFPVEIVNPSATGAPLEGVAPVCSGTSDGFLEFTIIGGTPPYLACLTPTIAEETQPSDPSRVCTLTDCGTCGTGFIGGLSSGTYTLSVSDANGCAATNNQLPVVIPSGKITIDTTTSTTTVTPCFNQANGTLEVNVDTIQAPTTVTITGPVTRTSSPQTTNPFIFAKIPGGTYQITATDGTNCAIASLTVPVTGPITFTYHTIEADLSGSAVSVNNLTQPPVCTNPSDGFIVIDSVIPNDGTVKFFSLDGATFEPFSQTTAPFVICAGPGFHTLTLAFDDLGVCTSQTVTVFVGTSTITFTPVVTNAPCFNGSATSGSAFDGNGTIKVTGISGGTPDPITDLYTFSIGTEAGFKPSNQSFTVPAGTYEVTIKDHNGFFSDPQIVTVEPQSEIILSFDVTTPITCPGSATGVITATATGGSGSYSFSLDGTQGTFITPPSPGTSLTFPPTAAGTYSLVAKDAVNGCFSRTQELVLQDAAPMLITYTTSPSACNSTTSTGDISISNISGGLPPYTAVIDGLSFTTKFGPGTTHPFPFVITSNLAPGFHTLTILDSTTPSACMSPTIEFEIQPVVITILSPPTITNATCFGSDTGSISLATAQVSGGTPLADGNYLYSIGTSDGFLHETGTPYTGLPAGIYAVTVQDANGCTSEQELVVITQPTEVTFSFDVSSPILCPGGPAQVTIGVPQGGSGTGFQFSIDGGTHFTAFPTDSTGKTTPATVTLGANGTSAAGTYILVVEDSNSCLSSIQELVLEDPQQIGIAFTTSPATCNSGNVGTIKITSVLDGNVGLSSSTTPSANFTFTTVGVNQTFTDTGIPPVTINSANGGPGTVPPGTYTITATDTNGCVSPSVTAVVEQFGPPIVDFEVGEVTANAGSDGSITIHAVTNFGPVVPPGKITFNVGNGATTDTDVPGTVSMLDAGVYEVTVTNTTTGCQSTFEVEVTEPTRTRIVGTISVAATTGSSNGCLTVLTESTAPLLYSLISVEGEIDIEDQISPLFSGLKKGFYTLKVKPRFTGTTPPLGDTLRTPPAIEPDGQGNEAFGIGVVDEVSAITATTIVTPIDCSTGLGGSITVVASGGGAPSTCNCAVGLSFSLNGGPFQTSPVFDNVTTTNNIVTIQDADCHTTSIAVTVPIVRVPNNNPIFNFLAKYCKIAGSCAVATTKP